MKHKDGEIFFNNRLLQASEFCSVLIPKRLSLEEYRDFIGQRLPFHTLSINMEDSCLFSFPPEAELWERSHFDQERLRDRKINTVDNCIYRKVGNGVFQRTGEEPEGSFETIGDYHRGPLMVRNFVVQDFIDQKVDFVASLTGQFESVEQRKIVYVNNFNFWGEPTRYWHHPFNLAHLECPMTSFKEQKQKEGITETWSYFGRQKSSSPLHIDDHSLSSAIYHLQGATKIWLTIPSGQKINFEALIDQKMPQILKPFVVRCDRKLTALKLLFTPRKLEEWGFPYKTIFQNPGEFLMLKSNSYHQVFSIGDNLTQSVNVCDDRYLNLNINNSNPFDVRIMKQRWMGYIGNPINWQERFQQVLRERNLTYQASHPVSPSMDRVPTKGGPSKTTKRKASFSSLASAAVSKTAPCKFDGCEKPFQYESYMMKHYHSFHQKLTKVECDQCGVVCYI